MRLIERLNEGLRCKLILICAPAGFGKTTLVGEWLGGIHQHSAWLSLDEGDNDPNRFVTYLISALSTVAPNIGEGLLKALESPQPPPTESILTALLNEITTYSEPFVLVLDDYHLIEAKAVDGAIGFLLEHLPPQMHLVITTRQDPNLPLARLRAKGQLIELRAADLRFTTTEAAEFLGQVMDLSLSASDLAKLSDRTEGWIAGLQLAALSMRGREDIPGFIKAFAGDHRYIVDYLVEEVLQRQPEALRSFLLQTSILERLNAPLCDAVTLGAQGKVKLESLERGNFFVVPLDDQRHWYRYHHLFADVLRAHLLAEQPEQVPALHLRASKWYEHSGSVADAIYHALAAEDFERAADLIQGAMPAMRRSRQEITLLGWLQSLPDELLQRRPVLSLLYAGTLLQSGQLNGVEARLQVAERWLDTTGDKGVADDSEIRGLRAWIASYRAGMALVKGDVSGTIKYARRALDHVPEDDSLGRGAATTLLGLAYWTSGDLQTAYQTHVKGIAYVKEAGHLSDALGGAIAQADMQMAQGRLREAISTFERGLQLANQGGLVLRGAADMHVGLSGLLYERNQLDVALQHLLKSQELGEHTGMPQNPYRWHVAMARIREAQGDLEGALELLQEAERLYMGDFSPNLHPIAAQIARIWVKQGRLGEALAWVRAQSRCAQDDLSYLREFEHLTLVRVLLARSKGEGATGSMSDAAKLLERLLQAAETGQRMGSVLEILILQALAHQIGGNVAAALGSLERALTLAESQGYMRIFVDEGPPMAALLEKAAKQGFSQNYARELLRAFGKAEPTPVKLSWLEPLSERERSVLRLLASELSGPEMARQLGVSLNTLRTHTKNIFSKLEVNNRRAAIRRAEELHLL